MAFEVSDGGEIVIEIGDVGILGELDGDLDGVLVVHAVDYHASFGVGGDGDDERAR